MRPQSQRGRHPRDGDGGGITDINPAYETALGTTKETLKIETAYGKAGQLVTALEKAYPQAKLETTGESAIGPTIGKEIAKNALLSVSLGLLAILLYIAFRLNSASASAPWWRRSTTYA